MSSSFVSKIEEILKNKKKILILCHNNPDPDSIASAFALKTLFYKCWKKQSIIAYKGIIGRAENKAMVKLLNITLKSYNEINPYNFKVIVLVDTQPKAGNSPLPSGLNPTIVIDHHPIKYKRINCEFMDIRPEYGSTSTIITEYLRSAGIEIDKKTATALLYGIKSDTEDLGRDVSSHDIDAFLFLYPLVDRKILYKIEHPKLPRSFFISLASALYSAKLYKDTVVVQLNTLTAPDLTALIADTFLYLKGIKWTLALGCYDGNIYFSIRTTNRKANAEKIAQKMVKGIGTAGGHNMIGGGKVEARGCELMPSLIKKFLKQINRSNIEEKPLIPQDIIKNGLNNKKISRQNSKTKS